MPLREWRQTQGLINSNLLQGNKLPLCKRNGDTYYWFEYLEVSNTVYFKYNVCRDMLSKDLYTFSKEIIQFLEEHTVEKLIIDFRNNFGGNSSLLEPFMDYVKHCGKINKEGSLFVIIGHETFSSALLNVLYLKENSSAMFIGEPTGGKPNCYGELQRFILKNSGLTVCYSTKYYKIIEDDTLLSFLPDVNIDYTIENYVNNQDPCLEYIINSDSQSL